jgi:hypothetical protein
MYVKAHKVPNSAQEIVCPWTGDAYVYMDREEIGNDSNLLEDALEILPEIFFKKPIPMRCPNGQVKIHVKL